MLKLFFAALLPFFFSSLPCFIAFVLFAVIVYIWMIRKDSEKKLEKGMKKSKDNL